MLNTIEKFPIILLSTPRSGSSAFCELLSEVYGALPNWKIFDEPLLPSHRFNDFYTNTKENSNYVLKIQCLEFKTLPPHILKIVEQKQCTVIGLTRRDRLSQYTSFYISEASGLWHFSKSSNWDSYNYKIDVDVDLIVSSIKQMEFQHDSYNQLKPIFDYEVEMEDFDLEQHKYMPSIKPINYDEIYKKVELLMDNKKWLDRYFILGPKHDIQQSKRIKR